MSSALPTPSDRLSTRLGRDGALEAALARIDGRPPTAETALSERADTPDTYVTAVRRLPAAMTLEHKLNQMVKG